MTERDLLKLAKEYDMDVTACFVIAPNVFEFWNYYSRILYILKIQNSKVDFQNFRGLYNMDNFVSDVQKKLDNAAE